MRIQQERKLTIMRELVDLFENGKGALTKDDLNKQLEQLSMSISSEGLGTDFVQSQIDVNKSTANLNNSNIIVNDSVIAKNTEETKKIVAETKRQEIENLFARSYEFLRNQKIEWDGKNAMQSFKKIGAETDSIKLDSYKKEVDNFVSTTNAVLENISPNVPLPADLQERVVDFIISNYSSVVGTILNDVKMR